MVLEKKLMVLVMVTEILFCKGVFFSYPFTMVVLWPRPRAHGIRNHFLKISESRSGSQVQGVRQDRLELQPDQDR